MVDAYAQLAGEGYLELRPGTRPRVTGCAGPCQPPTTRRRTRSPEPRYDFRPGVPDLSTFPRSAWLRSLREALARMRDADFGYTDPHGSEVLRLALRDYLGRVRGVVADAGRVVVTSGWCQGRTLRVPRAGVDGERGGSRSRTPATTKSGVSGARARGSSWCRCRWTARGSGWTRWSGRRWTRCCVTPAHQYPTGAVLSGARRGALLDWLRRREALAIEDDYDAEFRYDRAPVGALQGMDPERIVYAGTASKTLAPAMRLGWLVVPPRLLEAVQRQQRQADFGVSRIEQHAFADFLSRGELDRHLRRMRARYRARRDALVEALIEALPEVRVHGIRAGLHVTIQLRDGRPGAGDPGRGGAARRRADGDERLLPRAGARIRRMLLLGYGRSSEAVIRAGVRELAAAVRATRILAGPPQQAPEIHRRRA